MTHLFIYRLTSDTGLAPCVDNGLLSLAVCKGGQIRNGKPCHWGLRHQIGRDYSKNLINDPVYILGTYKDEFLYLARVEEVLTMEEYFRDRSAGRTDNIYSLRNGKLVRNNRLQKEQRHTNEDENVRDLAGVYVLLSKNFIYRGKDTVSIDLLKEKGPKFQGHKHIVGKEAEKIIKACEKYRDNILHVPHEPLTKKCGVRK